MKYLFFDFSMLSMHDYSIKPIQKGDIEKVRVWRNNQIDILRQAAPITPLQQEAYYAEHVWPEMEANKPRQVLVSLFYKERHIGYGGLVHIAWEHQRGEVSFLVEDCRAAVRTLLESDFKNFLYLIKKLAFEYLGLSRIHTETYAIRDEHIAILEASGFVLEGRMRQHVYINNQPVDSLIHGYLRTNHQEAPAFC